MKYRHFMSFPVKLTLIIAVAFAIMLSVFSIMFYHTGASMQSEAIKHIEYNAEAISRSIDEIVLNVYNVSDTFALDDRLLEYTSESFSSDPVKKRFATTQISNALFTFYDLLRNNEKMAAFYNNKSGELFNFLDPNANDAQCKNILETMEINHPDKLARFFWYPVRDNFLKTDTTGNIRRDKAIVGSRRVFSLLDNSYIGVHIFALTEEALYRKYSEISHQYNSRIYILTGEGLLLSSSAEEVLRQGCINNDLRTLIVNREYERFEHEGQLVFVQKSNVNDWLTVISVPQTSLTDVVNKLHGWIFTVVIFFALIAVVLVLVFYRRFMHPISKLSNAMKKVDGGDLKAYVDVSSTNNELSQMLQSYNAMLASINQNINDRLNMEKHKKQLEMDILMNQINPHFLYNTLETIVWKSTEAGHPDIGRIAASLGRMYRLSISGGNLFVSMHQEIEHVNAYIKIQQSRYEGSFVFECKADYSILREIYTLKMLLQPIVENSLSHGMEGLNRTLRIRLTVKVYDSHMIIRVTDTGIGIDSDRLSDVRRQIVTGERTQNTLRKKSTGIGMHNIYERLKIYFGEHAKISVKSKKNFGTTVELRLPIISEKDAQRINNEKNN